MKAVAYLRVSGQSQVDGEGFGRQLRRRRIEQTRLAMTAAGN